MAMQLERRPGQAQRCSLHWSAGMCSSRLTSCRGFDRIWKLSKCTPANWLMSLSARVHERLVGDHEATTARLISVKNNCLVSHNSTQGTSAEHQRRTWMPEAFDSTRRCPGGMPACCARSAQAGSKNSTHPCLVFQHVFKYVAALSGSSASLLLRTRCL